MKNVYNSEYSSRVTKVRQKINKTLLSALTAAFFLFGMIGTAQAQAGSTCGDPMQVIALPFNHVGATGDYGNNYNASNVPTTATGAVTNGTGATSYMIGFEAVYAITPIAAGTISINLTNDDGWQSLWVFTGCPFASTVGYHTAISGATRSIPNLPVVANTTYYIVVSSWDPPSVNYTISITGTPGLLEPLDDCTEANAGTITSTATEVCATTSFTLSATGTTGPAEGLVFQWQSSPAEAGNWADIAGANGVNYVVSAGILAETDFRLKANCSFGSLEDISNTVSVTLNPGTDCYCTPIYTSGCTSGAKINGVSTTAATVNMSNLGTGCTSTNALAYSDYTNDPAFNLTVAEGTSFNLKVDVISYSAGVKVWIDYNQNGIFETSELVTASTATVTSGNSHNALITIPAGTLNGETRMRVRIVEGSTSFDACESKSFGEAEDYKITIAEAPSCMPPSNLFVTNISETSADLGWSENGTADLWNIEYGPAGFTQGDGTLVEGVDENPVSVTLIPETEYHFYVQSDCGNGDESFWAGPYFFSNTYCTPTNTVNTNRYINSVVTEGALTNINKQNTGFTPGGYANYSGTDTLRVYPGQTISVTVTHPSSTYGYQVWVDWDGNYDFNGLDELVVNTSYVSSPHTFDLTIPLWANEITTRLRIRNAFTGNPSPACGAFSNGEAEDYTFVVVAAPTCYPVDNLQTTAITSGSIQVDWDAVNNESSWNVEYGPAGFELGQGTTETVTVNSFTANGLNPDEEYDIYVQADCGNDDESYWAKVSATTMCTSTTIPYTQNFETVAVPAIDNCGSLETNTGNPWKTEVLTANGFNSNVLKYAYNSQTANSWYFTQGLEMQGGVEYVLTYKYGSNSSSYGEKLRVTLGSSQSSASVIDTIRENNNIINTTATMDTVLFTPADDGVYYLGFQAYTQANAFNIFVDDIHVDLCVLQPTENGYTNACRLDGSIELSNIIESPYSHGVWSFGSNPMLVDSTSFSISTLPSGVYEVDYIVSNACTSDTTTAFITVFGASSAGNGGSITVCEGQPINLYAALSGNVDMGGDWYDYNNNLLGTSQPNAPNLQANYNYTYITSNGICPADTAVVEVVVNCDLAIGEEIMSTISIYPNPTSNVINVMNPSNLSALKIEMFDMNGRVVLVDNKSLANSDLGSINIEKLETGIYTLRVYNDEGQKTFKVVKQ